MNQSIFERIRVSNDETVLANLREEYQLLLHKTCDSRPDGEVGGGRDHKTSD